LTDCEHEWSPLEFEDGEKSKASVCSKCGALKSGQGTMVITADYIDFSPLTANPTLAEGRQWFRSDLDSIYWSPDGSIIERIETYRPGFSGSLVGIKGFEYLIEGGATDSWKFTMNPSVGVWIKQYSTDASFNAQMVYHGAYQHWVGDNTFVDVPNKAENVYGAGEEVTVHQIPDGTSVRNWVSPTGLSTGIGWNGEYLWLGSGSAQYVYKLLEDGTEKGGFATAHDAIGVTWDGTYVWVTNDTGHVYQYTKGGTQNAHFVEPGPSSRGIGWDGEYQWVSDDSALYIYQLTPAGVQKGGFPSPGPQPEGVTWDGEYLWHPDFSAAYVYQLTRDGTEKGGFVFPTIQPHGATWDGEYLWVDHYGGAGAVAQTYQMGSAGSFDLDYRITSA